MELEQHMTKAELFYSLNLMGHISPLFSTSAVFSCIVEERSRCLAGEAPERSSQDI